jgi:hypothetical protein
LARAAPQRRRRPPSIVSDQGLADLLWSLVIAALIAPDLV